MCVSAALLATNSGRATARTGFGVIFMASALSAALALFLVILIAVAAHAARGNRKRLALLFGVGRRLVLAVLAFLVLSQGLIAFTTIAAGADIAFGAAPVFLLLPIAITTLLGTLAVIATSFDTVRLPPMVETAVATDVPGQPQLWKLVSDIASQLHAPRPDNVILSIRPAFYVTTCAVGVRNRAQAIRGSTLCISLPLLRIMDETELAAVIGHELAHFRDQDVAYTRRFAPVYAHMASVLRLA